MSFTAPRTWTATELVTAAMMNTHVRDNLNALWVGTTAGDMDYYNTATSKARIPMGSTGNVITPFAGVPTWAPFASITFPGKLQLVVPVSIPDSAYTPVEFDFEAYDVYGVCTIGADAKYTVPLTGYYQVDASANFKNITIVAGMIASFGVWVNGALISPLQIASLPGVYPYLNLTGSDVLRLTAADTVKIRVFQSSGGAIDLWPFGNYMSVVRVG